ncbi:hypothetical protein COLO4_37075 [Corchorus olitorius]|uniref:Uncharacterized protein n=1 Tax=Corchorus olitorius TaxID=93759 RepID=A0A1R3G3D3_9ROSI|nr:hypothetical protein COLO4_37075 [Corchorus olitorius]
MNVGISKHQIVLKETNFVIDDFVMDKDKKIMPFTGFEPFNFEDPFIKEYEEVRKDYKNACKNYGEDYGEYFDGGYLTKKQCHKILAKAYGYEPDRKSRILIAQHRAKKGLQPAENFWKDDWNHDVYSDEICSQAPSPPRSGEVTEDSNP